MKSRFNISIETELHEWGAKHARKNLGIDFSAYLTELLVKDRKKIYGADSKEDAVAVILAGIESRCRRDPAFLRIVRDISEWP